MRDGATDHGFAGPGFADETQDLRGLELKRKLADHRHILSSDRRADTELTDAQKIGHCSPALSRRTSSVRRRPSPSRLKPVTVTKIARTGKNKPPADS